MEPLTLKALAKIFVKTGTTTFGGGDPTMAALQRELTERRNWLTPEQYGLAYSIARITPGTNVLAFSAGVGWLLARWPGAWIAVIGGSLPPAVIVVWLTLAYESATRHPLTAAAMSGILAAVTGMMLAAAWLLVKAHANRNGWLRILLITGGTVFLREVVGWSPVSVMAVAAVAGWFWRET